MSAFRSGSSGSYAVTRRERFTVDQGIEYPQNLLGLNISVVVMMAPSNDVDDLRPLLPAVEQSAGNIVTWRNPKSGWLTWHAADSARDPNALRLMPVVGPTKIDVSAAYMHIMHM
jgi:hypothetical protein